MKTRELICTLAMALTISGAAWATDFKMQATPVDPGAQGTVTVDAGKAGQNASIKVKVEHPAKPSLLTPPASAYVVWIEQSGEAPQNGGTIRIGDDEKGEVLMTTTAPRFTVLITAETDTHPQAPSERVVLRSNVQQ
jgi:hypothetical protein